MNIIRMLLFIVFISLGSSSSYSFSKDRYPDDGKQSLVQVLDKLQASFSYLCGLRKFSKRKTVYKCNSDRAVALVTLRKDPRIDDVRKGLKELSIKFLETEEFPILNDSIEAMFNYLGGRNLSYVCGNYNFSSKKNGDTQVKANCSLRLDGEFLGNAMVKFTRTKNTNESSGFLWKSFTVIFKK